MIFREIAFILVIFLFAAIAVFLVADLLHANKKMDKHRKKNKTDSKTKKSYYR
jgi:tellurite resistance protein TehA-like permease